MQLVWISIEPLRTKTPPILRRLVQTRVLHMKYKLKENCPNCGGPMEYRSHDNHNAHFDCTAIVTIVRDGKKTTESCGMRWCVPLRKQDYSLTSVLEEVP